MNSVSNRVLPAVRRWLRRLALHGRERYLSQAENHADLERRMRTWDTIERRKLRFIGIG